MRPIAPMCRLALTASALCAATSLFGCKRDAPDPAPPDPTPPPQTAPAAGTSTDGGPETGGGTAGLVRPPLPEYWFESDFDKWIGKRWSEIELIGFLLPKVPSGMEKGTRYVVFYGRTCEHCEEMFQRDLAPDATLAAQVTAVEVPSDDPPSWQVPATACELLTLPRGVDWIITTPLTLRVEDGIVRCVTEGDHKECMGLDG